MELWVAGGGPMSVIWRQTHGQDHGPVRPTKLEACHIQAETWRISCTCTQIRITQVATHSESQLAPRRTIKSYDGRCSTLTVRHPPNKMRQMCLAYYCRPMIAEHILRTCWREWIRCSMSFDAEVAHSCHQLQYIHIRRSADIAFIVRVCCLLKTKNMLWRKIFKVAHRFPSNLLLHGRIHWRKRLQFDIAPTT